MAVAMPTLIKSRKFQSTILGTITTVLIPLLGQIAVACGMPAEVAGHAVEILMWAVPLLFGVQIVGIAAEDYAAKRDQPAQRSLPAEVSEFKPASGGGFQLPPTLSLLLIAALAMPMIGCTATTDRKVETIQTQLAADLTTRGALERAAVKKYLDGFRAQKLAELDSAHDAALRFLEAQGTLNAAAARKASDRAIARKTELNRQVDLAIQISLDGLAWYDHAAAVVMATQRYYQTKDEALAEGARAFVEAFGASYVANRSEPANEAEAKAQGLLDQVHGELRSFLEARLGVTTVPAVQ